MRVRNFFLRNSTIILAIFLILVGCKKDKVMSRTYTIRTPIFAPKSEVLANMKMNAPRNLVNTGKIYISGNYIYLNEREEGIHVIDNSNPSHPTQVGFISIPGNTDIAVKGNALYADFYSELVTFDISDMLHAKISSRIENVFPEKYYTLGYGGDTSLVIVGWNSKDTIVYGETENFPPGDCQTCDLFPTDFNKMTAAPSTGGSMASFAIVNDYLYAVDHHTLKAISISNSQSPTFSGEISAGWDIETIFPLKNDLILGSMGGLFIFDISNPALPAAKGSINHSRACDPVVADAHNAFVTLRAGTNCGPSNNELQVINIDDLQSPSLLKTYPMTGPKGLGKSGNTLFICDASAGLKIYDVADVYNIKLIATLKGMDTYDVIVTDRIAFVVAAEGIFQFDISDIHNIRQLSKIQVN